MHIKICGITNVSDALAAAQLGAGAIGLNFYPRSKRCISEETAREIVDNLPPFVEPVALFVNQKLDDVVAWARRFALLRTLQIHADVHETLPAESFQFIPAFAVRDGQSITEIQQYLSRCRVAGKMPAAVLVDAYVEGEYGGTGQTAPWQLLAKTEWEVPLILAGGLTPENVADAVRIVRPYAVDVATGVERTPGQKDVEKMRRFIGEAQKAAAKYE